MDDMRVDVMKLLSMDEYPYEIDYDYYYINEFF